MGLTRPCLGCGQLTTSSYCPRCTNGGRNLRWWRQVRAARRDIDRNQCVYCGSTTDLTVDLDPRLRSDHTIATIDDCVTACRRCNARLR
jgi:5-methylcytosine-specific restriction endonuclease McrA